MPSGLSVYTEDKDTGEWTEDSWVSTNGIGVENVMNSTTASMVSDEIKFSHDENGETLEVSLKPNSTYTRLQLNGSDDIALVSDIPADELPTITSGDAGKVLTVNSGETGVEWTTPTSGTTYSAGTGVVLNGTTFQIDETWLTNFVNNIVNPPTEETITLETDSSNPTSVSANNVYVIDNAMGAD